MKAKISYFEPTRPEKIFAGLSASVKQLRQAYDEAFDAWGQASQILTNMEAKLEESNANYLQSITREKKLLNNLKEVQNRYALVCSAVSPTQHHSEKYEQFTALTQTKLLPLINSISFIENQAELIAKIQGIDDELRLVAAFSSFTTRTIIAVAGSFSSGKSSFISSLLDSNEKLLPVGIEPVTAIPTYVMHSEQLKITGYPNGGGSFDVSPDIYARLSHKFVEEFGFNLRDLLPFMSLEVPFKNYQHLAFIDLPGYNPGNRDGATTNDKNATQEFLSQAHALIWMIGLDANGTLAQDDLEHLRDLTKNDIPLYVVLNKADLRPPSALNEVMDQIADVLMLEGIQYLGLSAYSSEDGGELLFRDMSIWQALVFWNQPQQAMKQVLMKVEEVLTSIEKDLKAEIKKKSDKSKLVKALELNLLELGTFENERSSGFQIDDYLTDSDDVKAVRTGWGGSFFSSILSQMDQSKPKGKAKTAKKSNATTLRELLIYKVNSQFRILRDEYNSEHTESDLAALLVIRSELKAVLLG